MSAKNQNSGVEAVRDAATGYMAVVLGLACFLILLCVVMAGVRVVFQLGPASTPATAPVATVTTGAATQEEAEEPAGEAGEAQPEGEAAPEAEGEWAPEGEAPAEQPDQPDDSGTA